MLTTSDFTFIKQSKTLVAEVSSLPQANGELAGNTIHITSDHTGKTEKFVLYGTEKNDEGELVCVQYAPETPLKNVARVTIYND